MCADHSWHACSTQKAESRGRLSAAKGLEQTAGKLAMQVLSRS